MEENFQTPQQTQRKPFNGLALAGMILGICALVFCWVPVLNVILVILGFVFSILGLKKLPKGMATAGLICSIIALVINIALWTIAGCAWKKAKDEGIDGLNKWAKEMKAFSDSIKDANDGKTKSYLDEEDDSDNADEQENKSLDESLDELKGEMDKAKSELDEATDELQRALDGLGKQ